MLVFFQAFVATIVSVIRAVVSMIVDATTVPGDLTDTVSLSVFLLIYMLCRYFLGVYKQKQAALINFCL